MAGRYDHEIKIKVKDVRETIKALEDINFHSGLFLLQNEDIPMTENSEVKWMYDVQQACRVLIRNNPRNVFINKPRKETI